MIRHDEDDASADESKLDDEGVEVRRRLGNDAALASMLFNFFSLSLTT